MAVQTIDRTFAQGATSRIRLRLTRKDGTPFDASAASVVSEVRKTTGELVLTWTPSISTMVISGTTWWILTLDATYVDTEGVPADTQVKCDIELTKAGVRYRVAQFSSLQWTSQTTLG